MPFCLIFMCVIIKYFVFEFINELKDLSKIETSYRYQNYGGKLLVVQGHKDILLMTGEQIVLKLKKGDLSIKGNNLGVDELSPNSIIIKGSIINIERSGE